MVGAILVALAVVGFVGFCKAQDWIVMSGLAKHLDGESHCNNHITKGGGFERRISGTWRAAGGIYDNSNCRLSAYAAAVWLPLRSGPWGFGGLAGGLTGYRMPVSPAGGLAATYEERRWGVNLIYIPPFKESGNVAWLQLKVPW